MSDKELAPISVEVVPVEDLENIRLVANADAGKENNAGIGERADAILGLASDVIDEIGTVTLDGVQAMARNDTEELGRIMTQNHKLLSILGVSCDQLNKLVNASLPYSYGAKLTGSGGGGSMIALTDRPEQVCEAIAVRGGVPMVVHTGEPGVRIEDEQD